MSFHVMSARTGCGLRLTTALFEVSDGGVALVEHRGAANSVSDRRAQRAIDWLLDEVRAGRVGVNIAALEQARRKRISDAGGEDAATRRLYPLYSSVNREWVFRAYYAPFLAPSKRGLSREAWLD